MAETMNKLLDSVAFDAAMAEIGKKVNERFPSIPINQLDTLGTDGSKAAFRDFVRDNTQLRYRVTMNDGGKTIGILDVLTDSMMHTLTEVITTHATLDDEGKLTDSVHECHNLRTYFRSYNINSPFLTNEKGSWSDWQELASGDFAGRIASLEKKLDDSNFMTAAEAKALVDKYF